LQCLVGPANGLQNQKLYLWSLLVLPAIIFAVYIATPASMEITFWSRFATGRSDFKIGPAVHMEKTLEKHGICWMLVVIL